MLSFLAEFHERPRGGDVPDLRGVAEAPGGRPATAKAPEAGRTPRLSSLALFSFMRRWRSSSNSLATAIAVPEDL